MKAELIGATATLPEVVGGSLKQQLLIFDRIACPEAARYVREFEADPELTPNDLLGVVPGLAWLMQRGVVFSPEWKPDPISPLDLMRFTTYAKGRADVAPVFRTLDQTYAPESQPILADFARGIAGVLAGIHSRQLATHLQAPLQRVVPITSDWVPISAASEVVDVIELVIKDLPVPGESHSFEDILGFREEAKSAGLTQALRVWINETASGKLGPIEVADKLEFLVDEHELALKRAGMSRNTSVIETLVVTTAEIAESLVKLQWKETAKRLFALGHSTIRVMQAEMTLPGREVAYIVKARERFGT